MNNVGGGGQMLDLVKANMLMNSKDNPVYTFFVMTILEFFIKYITILTNYLKTYADKWFQDKFKSQLNKLPINVDDNVNEVCFTRRYGKARPEAYILVDAVLMRILEVPTIKKLVYANLTYMVNYQDVIEIDKGISFQLTGCDLDGDGEIECIKFRLFSDNNNTGCLKEFIKKCETEYEIKKKNKLGNDLFFFDHHIKKSDSHGNDYVNDKIFFTRNLFITNRDLNNVFFEQKLEVQTRLNIFLNHKEWYDTRGIPYTLGFLLHGTPGTGKTSTIKAIANKTHRHIININLNKIKSKTQLKQLFYDDKLWVMEKRDVGENLESYIIPIEKRLYVMEDIDAVKDSFFMRRDLKEKLQQEQDEEDAEDDDSDKDDNDKNNNNLRSNSKKNNNSILNQYINEIKNRPENHEINNPDQQHFQHEQLENNDMFLPANELSSGVDLNDANDLISPIYKKKQDTKDKDKNIKMTRSINTRNKNSKSKDDTKEDFNLMRALKGDNKKEQNNKDKDKDKDKDKNKKDKKDKKDEEDEDDSDDDDELDLSSILNILDGTLETPGRMIIITSNYPEKLDQALIRPGRIDLILEFKKANHMILAEMYQCFFEKIPPMDTIKQIVEYQWSPAEVAQIMFKNFNSSEQALNDLITYTPKEYFKFSYFSSQEESSDSSSDTSSESSTGSNNKSPSNTMTTNNFLKQTDAKDLKITATVDLAREQGALMQAHRDQYTSGLTKSLF